MNGIVETVVAVDGIPTRFRVSGKGPSAIVLFPAAMETGSGFGRLQFLLDRRLPHGVATVAVDPPGYSREDGEEAGDFGRWRSWCARLAAYVESSWTERLFYVGNSSGGVAATLAALRSTRTAGLCLVCWCDWRLGPPPSSDVLCPTDQRGLDHLLQLSWHAAPNLADATRVDMLRAAGKQRAHVQSFDADVYRLDLRRYRGPLTVVAGQNDGLVSVEQARATLASRPDGEFMEIAECGHYPHREQPLALARILAGLVRRSAPSPRAGETENERGGSSCKVMW